jgi:hypothetical protein
MWNSFSDELFFTRLDFISRRTSTPFSSSFEEGRGGIFVLRAQARSQVLGFFQSVAGYPGILAVRALIANGAIMPLAAPYEMKMGAMAVLGMIFRMI